MRGNVTDQAVVLQKQLLASEARIAELETALRMAKHHLLHPAEAGAQGRMNALAAIEAAALSVPFGSQNHGES